MRFPGARYLHGWDLTTHSVSLDALLLSCQQVGLTGYAELQTAAGAGMLFYYMGAEVSAVYRQEGVGYHGAEALRLLREALSAGAGSITMFELPTEMAHILRGITNRRKLPQPLAHPTDLDQLQEWIKKNEHTGMIEVNIDPGGALLLLVNGRISNMYWDAGDGVVLEAGPALLALRQSLAGGNTSAYISDFSRDVWRSRHELQAAALRNLQIAGQEPPSPDRESALRTDLLKAIDRDVPAMVQALVFDLMTGVVLTRRIRGTSALRAALMAEKIPQLMLHARTMVTSENEDDLQMMELETDRVIASIAVIGATQEAVAIIADRAQPTAQVSGMLGRHARAYSAARRG